MSTTVPSGKKASLCRYFINSGACLYGEDCQFLHPNASMSNAFPLNSNNNGIQEKPSISESLPNSGDQYFNATFSSIPSTVPEMDQFAGGPVRPRSRNSLLGSLSQSAKPFVPSPGGQVEDGIANDFAALNLASMTTKQQQIHQQTPPDFSRKASTNSLSHSASTPSFSTYSTITSSSVVDTNHINPGIHSLNLSPCQSPVISPTSSPLMLRRTSSPVTPHRQTTIPQKSSSNTIQENVGGTTYFYSPDDFSPQHQAAVLPNFVMYPSIPPHIAHMKLKANMPQFFMPDEIKMQILNEHALTMAQLDQNHKLDIPEEVDNYHNLFPLEALPSSPLQKSSIFNYPTTCFKAVNTKDGFTYCLRRVHGFRLANTKCMPLLDIWKKMYHPNIVQLKEVFTTKVFGDNSIVFVYDFFPGSETLMSRHFSNMATNGYNGSFKGDLSTPSRAFSNSTLNGGNSHNSQLTSNGLLPESLIWTYVVQLSSALRAIHANGLACRSLDPTKILLYGKTRLRINCLGVSDVLNFDNNQGNHMGLIQHYQHKDLYAFGNIVLALACNSGMQLQRDNIPNALELVARSYSPDLKNLILYLLTNQNRPRSINDVMPMIGARFFTQLDAAHLRSDVLHNELAKEVENGRLFRLMCKFGAINERQEFNLDQEWSETGDRYILKLFRDYLFHQVDENGAPWMDISHVIQCLNKVDAGVPEKICLMSRDEQSVIIVSYGEIKRCFESSFSELLSAGHQSPYT